ncbi:hypothetical protein [Mammaliicoccus sciuri]
MTMHEMFLEQAKIFFDMNMDPIFLVPIAITMEEYNQIREQYFPTKEPAE